MNYDPNAQSPQPQWQPPQQPMSTWYPPTQPGQQRTPPPPPTYTQYPSPHPTYPQPSMYPPPYYAPPPAPPAMKPYSPQALYVLIALYACSWLVFATRQEVLKNLGVALWMGIAVSVLILDARGLVRLQGTIKTSGTKTFFIALLCFFLFPLWLGAYLACTFTAYRRPPLSITPIRRKATVAFLVGTGITLFAFVSASTGATTSSATTSQVSSASATNTVITAPATTIPTHTAVTTKKPAPTPTTKPVPQSVPATQPTPTPKPAATVPPQPAPTSPPAPTYNTDPTGGQLVYNPPADFCDANACVSTFWTATRGYVVQCANGEYSHSGGVSGACSRDGGVVATLYQHG